MHKKSYKTEFHITFCIYFSDMLPTGSDLAGIWKTFKFPVDHPAEMSFSRLGDVSNPNSLRCKLGSDIIYNTISDTKYFNMISISSYQSNSMNAIIDSDANFTFTNSGVWNGESTPPMLTISISNNLLDIDILGYIKTFFYICDVYSPICGFVDISRSDEVYAGMVYEATWPRTASLHQWIDQMSWLYSGAKKKDRLRGLHWGNYLGAQILSRLGGIDRFSELCLVQARNHDKSLNSNIWRFEKGLFISLSPDPLDCQPNSPLGLYPVAEANLKWLIRELGTNGVLDQW